MGKNESAVGAILVQPFSFQGNEELVRLARDISQLEQEEMVDEMMGDVEAFEEAEANRQDDWRQIFTVCQDEGLIPSDLEYDDVTLHINHKRGQLAVTTKGADIGALLAVQAA